MELDSEDILPNLVVKQDVARQFQLTPVPVPVDPPAKRAKKMKEEVSPSHETTGATGDVKMERERALQNLAATAPTPTQTSVKMGPRMCRTSTNLKKRMKSLGS